MPPYECENADSFSSLDLPLESLEEKVERGRIITIERTVSFDFDSPNFQMFKIKHFEDMTRSEVVATWYQKKELHRMQQELRQLLQRNCEDLDEKQHTLRGLEAQTCAGRVRRRAVIQDGLTCVLKEQLKRKVREPYEVTGTVSLSEQKTLRELHIACAYLEYSTKSLQEAQERALQDELISIEYHLQNAEQDEKYLSSLVKDFSSLTNKKSSKRCSKSLKKVAQFVKSNIFRKAAANEITAYSEDSTALRPLLQLTILGMN